MTLARNVGGHFHAVRETHTGDLSDGGVRFSRRFGRNFRTDAALEGRRVEGRAILEHVKTPRQSDGLGFP